MRVESGPAGGCSPHTRTEIHYQRAEVGGQGEVGGGSVVAAVFGCLYELLLAVISALRGRQRPSISPDWTCARAPTELVIDQNFVS